MLNKDKRSLLLSLILGDGCLHTVHRGNKSYGTLIIGHGIAQADYQKWKAELLSNCFDKQIKVRTSHQGSVVQISVGNNTFKAWRKFVYRNNKKDLSLILPFIRHPELALAIWLMDDGYVDACVEKRKNGENKAYSAKFRIYTCDQSEETQHKLIAWFKQNFDVNLKIRFQKSTKRNKSYPFLVFTADDTIKVWKQIRQFVLQFKSMQYKFRHAESAYQRRMAQRTPNES